MGFGLFIHRSDSIHTDRPGQHTERTASFMQQPGDQKPNGQRAAKNKNPAEEASRKFAISARYIRQLFSDEGTSISDYVTAQRLACVHSCLTDRRQKLRRIADIAQASRPIATVTEKLQRRRE